MSDEHASSPPTPLSAEEIVEVAMAMPDSVLLVDTHLQVMWANPSAERLFGVAVADSGGMSGLDFIHPDDLESTVLAMSSVWSKQVGSPFEVRLRTPTGWRLVEVIGVPMGTNLVLSIRDLTERRRWEVAHDADARFRALIHNAAMLKVLVDGSGVVQGSSAAITRLLGHDQAQLEGRELAELVDDTDAERWRAALAEVCREGIESGSSVTLDLVFVRRDGQRARHSPSP